MQLDQVQVRPAGFWIRLAAQILDGIIIGIPLAILLTLLGGGSNVGEMILSNGAVDPAQMQQYIASNSFVSLISLL